MSAAFLHSDSLRSQKVPQSLGLSPGTHPQRQSFNPGVLETSKMRLQNLGSGLISVGNCRKMLISQGKTGATITIFDPNLKEALLNTSKDHGYWSGPFTRFPEYGTKLHWSGVYKHKSLKATNLPPSYNQGQAYIPTHFRPIYLLSMCDQAQILCKWFNHIYLQK